MSYPLRHCSHETPNYWQKTGATLLSVAAEIVLLAVVVTMVAALILVFMNPVSPDPIVCMLFWSSDFAGDLLLLPIGIGALAMMAMKTVSEEWWEYVKPKHSA